MSLLSSLTLQMEFREIDLEEPVIIHQRHLCSMLKSRLVYGRLIGWYALIDYTGGGESCKVIGVVYIRLRRTCRGFYNRSLWNRETSPMRKRRFYRVRRDR